MKLRSIALAGLLSAGLFMSSGCSIEDVTDAINDALKSNIIHVANGQSNTVTFEVEGDLNSNTQDVNGLTNKMFFTNGQDSYSVSNTVSADYGVTNSTKTFPKDGAYLYGLCANGNVITDSATSGQRQIEVVNLSNTAVGTNGNVEVVFYGENNEELDRRTINGEVAACSKATLPASSVVLKDLRAVSVNGTLFTIPNYDADIDSELDKLNNVDLDLVVYDVNDQKGTIIPLATAKQLSLQ